MERGDLVRAIREFLEAGNFAAALSMIQETESLRTDGEVLYLQGLCLGQAGELDAGIAALKSAMANGFDSHWTACNIAAFEFLRGDREEGIKYAVWAAVARPDINDSWALLNAWCPGEFVQLLESSIPRESGLRRFERLYRQVFQSAPQQQHAWCNATFPAAGREVQTVIGGIKDAESLWLTNVFREAEHLGTPGAIVVFGTDLAARLDVFLRIGERLGIRRQIWGIETVTSEAASNGDWPTEGARIGRILDAERRPHLHLVQYNLHGDMDPQCPSVPDRVQFAQVFCDTYASAAAFFRLIDGRLVDGAILCIDSWEPDADRDLPRAFFEFAKISRDRYLFQPLALILAGRQYILVNHLSQ